MKTRLDPILDSDLIERIRVTYEGWGERWRQYNKEQEERMKNLTVTFHHPLAYTKENREAMRAVFENQTGMPAMDLRLTDVNSGASGTVWGFHNERAVLMFVVP